MTAMTDSCGVYLCRKEAEVPKPGCESCCIACGLPKAACLSAGSHPETNVDQFWRIQGFRGIQSAPTRGYQCWMSPLLRQQIGSWELSWRMGWLVSGQPEWFWSEISMIFNDSIEVLHVAFQRAALNESIPKKIPWAPPWCWRGMRCFAPAKRSSWNLPLTPPLPPATIKVHPTHWCLILAFLPGLGKKTL